MSAGRLTLSFDPLYKWFRMSKPSSAYGLALGMTSDLHRAYIQEAISMADPGIDFSKSDEFLIVSNPDGGSLTTSFAYAAYIYDGILLDNKMFYNGITLGKILPKTKDFIVPHEFCHTLGLVDLYSYSSTAIYTGSFSIMGDVQGTSPELTAWGTLVTGLDRR